MWFMRDRIQRWPLHWVFAYYAVATTCLSVILDAIFGVWGGPGWAVLFAMLFAAVMTSITWWQRRADD